MLARAVSAWALPGARARRDCLGDHWPVRDGQSQAGSAIAVGALGCVAVGVGTTDMANAFMTSAVRFAMPEVLRIEVDGRLPVGVSAKDLGR